MAKELDNCEICKGAQGGVNGNENIVDGVVMCDYCSVQYDMKKKELVNRLKLQKKGLGKYLVFLLISMFAFWTIVWVGEFITLSNDQSKQFQKIIEARSIEQHKEQLLQMDTQGFMAIPENAIFPLPTEIWKTLPMKLKVGDCLGYNLTNNVFLVMKHCKV